MIFLLTFYQKNHNLDSITGFLQRNRIPAIYLTIDFLESGRLGPISGKSACIFQIITQNNLLFRYKANKYNIVNIIILTA